MNRPGWAKAWARALAVLDRFTAVTLSMLAVLATYAGCVLFAGSAATEGAGRCEWQATSMCVELSNDAQQAARRLRQVRDAMPSEAVSALQQQRDLDNRFFIPFYAVAYALFAFWAGRAGASWALSAALVLAVAVLVWLDATQENAHMQQLIVQLRGCTVTWMAGHACAPEQALVSDLFEASRWKWTAYATVSALVAWGCARAVRRRGPRLWLPAALGLAATVATLLGAWWPETTLGQRVAAIEAGFGLGFATLIALGWLLVLRGARTVKRMRRR